MNRHERTRRMVWVAVLMAVIAVMTVVPYTGYISYGAIEITTLHLVVILGSVLLGWKMGALLGAFWGLTCLLRAFTNPLFLLFTNPMISLVPRIFVGAVPGLVFGALMRTKLGRPVAIAIAAAAGALTNTVLVLSAINFFGGMTPSFAAVYEIFKQVVDVVITFNGALELGMSVLLVPAVYAALQKSGRVPGGQLAMNQDR